MEDLQALTNQILARTKAEGEAKIAEYEKIAHNKVEQTRHKLAESEKTSKEAIELKLKSDYERQSQTFANQQRNTILAKKQILLNSVFDQAVEKLSNWDEKQFSKFLAGVLGQLDQKKAWTLLVGEASVDLFKHDQVKAVLTEHSFVTISEEVVKNKAGFILQQGGIDYNFCFDELINELKKEFSPQLASLAF